MLRDLESGDPTDLTRVQSLDLSTDDSGGGAVTPFEDSDRTSFRGVVSFGSLFVEEILWTQMDDLVK